MPIQILPAQLANQIAAGEVVERPASVVKELVENSLDAGANQITIDIENGGASLIRIRDNGIGIAKDELTLALARHATSKISSLEDLDAILSLGFRGEALASISSVSRLTLTSRTEEQQEAWQVYAQGRDMETTIQPAAHPVGSTVEVANLFFNTPARRKFLRTDKTEFSHIDEVIRRIALAKPQIAFTLTHNGKTIRQYKMAQTDSQKLKRVAAICGEDFVRHALQINWQHNDLHLHGWIAQARFNRSQNDLAYCYINGRMVRDKVINHAIRQAYAPYLNNEQYPAFVLFLDLNPTEVDVNVHPTKHEVRFHQARLIHDFICQGISQALQTELSEMPFEHPIDPQNQINEPQASWENSLTPPNRAAAGDNIFSLPPQVAPESKKSYPSAKNYQQQPTAQQLRQQQQSYAELLQPHTNPPATTTRIESEPPLSHGQLYRCLALVAEKALLLQQDTQFYLLSIQTMQREIVQAGLQHPIAQPLLIPLVLHLNSQQFANYQHLENAFLENGFEIVAYPEQQRITINRVPADLRQQNLQNLILNLLNLEKTNEFLTAVLTHIHYPKIDELAEGIAMLNQLEQLTNLCDFLIPVDFSSYLEQIQ